MINGQVTDKHIPQLMRVAAEQVREELIESVWHKKAIGRRRVYGKSLSQLMEEAPSRLELKLKDYEVGELVKDLIVVGGRDPYDLAFFLLSCGLPDSFSIASILERVGFGTRKRKAFADDLSRIAAEIERFNARDIPGIVGLLEVRFGRDKVPLSIRELPKNLRNYAKWVSEWPPEEYALSNAKQGMNYLTVYFSLFLPRTRNRWKILQELMDLSVYVVWGDAQGKGKDLGLTAAGLRKRIERFNRDLYAGMQQDVAEYLAYSRKTTDSPNRKYFRQFLGAKFQ